MSEDEDGFTFTCTVDGWRVRKALENNDTHEEAARVLVRAIKRKADDMVPRLTARLGRGSS